MNKRVLFITLLSVFISFISSSNQGAYAAQCAPGQCDGPGEYICEGGTKCCTCGAGGNCGCPSYSCQIPQDDDVEYANCTWPGPNGNVDQCSCDLYRVDGDGNRLPGEDPVPNFPVSASYVGGTCSSCGGGGGGSGLCCKKSCPSGNGQCGVGSGGNNEAKYWCKLESQCSDAVVLQCNFTWEDAGCRSSCPGRKGDACGWRKDGTEKSWECSVSRCVARAPAAPLTTTGGQGTYPLTADIPFAWSQPHTWGNACAPSPCDDAGYNLFIDGVQVRQFGVNSSGTTRTASSIGVGPHTWYVQAYRTGGGKLNSATKSFTITSTSVAVQGLIWNATGQSCTASPSESLEIVRGTQPGNIPSSSSVSVTLDGITSGTWDTSQSGYSYQFPSVTQGSHVITANVPDPVGFPNSKYYLACVNGQSASSASVNAQSNPTTLHLGFKITSSGWFQTLGGDVFAGCTQENCADSISVGIPAATDILGGFTDALISSPGTLFSSSDASVKAPDNSDKFTSDSNRFAVVNGELTQNFANGVSFSAPSNATEISAGACSNMFSSGSLNPATTYRASRSCVQSGLDSLSGNYSTSSDGVVTIYVEADGQSLSFDKDFTSSSSDRRILFVTTSPVEITSDVGVLAPTSSTPANIQASIVSQSTIVFLGNEEGEEDTTVIVEGPLVSTAGEIQLNRDRGTQNGYPAQVIRYNPIYLSNALTEGTRGAGVVDVSWILNN